MAEAAPDRAIGDAGRAIGNAGRLCPRRQARQHPVQPLPPGGDCRARARRFCRRVRSRGDRHAPRAGERAAAPHPGRNPLSRRRLDDDDLRRRLYRLGDLRSFQPQDHHADRRRLDHLFDLADPAGAERRAADRRPPAHRPGRRLCRLGAVPDRRRIDAGAASAHLQRDLRDVSGRCVHRAAVRRLSARRQSQCASG